MLIEADDRLLWEGGLKTRVDHGTVRARREWNLNSFVSVILAE